ncbi:tol-pal system protein YbgF [Sulfitobacter donghicola]|uniref:Cell division coordinator CpoB n=1 Tax=Sulfitobacter donghicola DSW-25 = KCTC 12864 = JCM 14565 TaxID=1300350 RepID=A0A073IS53_9RHOB|nr:tol-pal system protein YbgF [Sulfitobacter donghicola]KEJ88232.1 tol-pal system protein YbgF [Sulfitobacter donghicola DSW-25 = KCTC 12864 = JCM 14565]KIN68826.1 Tetratricopeptide TPR 2 [Sulfitobacter donghicola DSW-25 = KCTC 12864 = JCM 14565]
MRFAFIFAVVLGAVPLGAAAQDAQTLADIRQELSILNVEMSKLKRELSTTGTAGGVQLATSVLDRVNAMESELSRVTAKTEELEYRINRIVDDGTRRVADLEFRLVELEGGDISTLGETTTLGGTDQATAPAPAPTPTNTTTQLAVGEQDDFKRAQEALASSDFRTAADKFATFNQTYPGSPLAAEADLRRGDALQGTGDTREAARAYLASFGAAPTGPTAPETLFKLGASLGALGQSSEACVTLGEVPARFASSEFAAAAVAEQSKLGCN